MHREGPRRGREERGRERDGDIENVKHGSADAACLMSCSRGKDKEERQKGRDVVLRVLKVSAFLPPLPFAATSLPGVPLLVPRLIMRLFSLAVLALPVAIASE